MAAELKKAIDLAIAALAKQNGAPLHPDEIIRPMIEALAEVVNAIGCPKCKTFFVARLANTFMVPLGHRPIQIAQDLIDHVRLLPDDATMVEEDRLATVEPAGHA